MILKAAFIKLICDVIAWYLYKKHGSNKSRKNSGNASFIWSIGNFKIKIYIIRILHDNLFNITEIIVKNCLKFSKDRKSVV